MVLSGPVQLQLILLVNNIYTGKMAKNIKIINRVNRVSRVKIASKLDKVNIFILQHGQYCQDANTVYTVNHCKLMQLIFVFIGQAR